MFRSVVVLCALVLPMTIAVINGPSESKVERREAPFETYGPPPVQQQHQQQHHHHEQTFIIQPVYGAPAVSKFPPPPPERPPPPPGQEYGVPVLQYGPPKVAIEYGTPHLQGGHSVQQIQTGNHHHHQVVNHGSSSLSFFDQIKQSLGFGGGESHSHSHQPHSVYGPPPQAPTNHFIPPKVHTKYGVPPKQHLFSKPPQVYGPPPQKPHSIYGPPKQQFPISIPKQTYGLPIKPPVNFRPQQSYGVPALQPAPAQIRQPLPAYGPPLSLPNSLPNSIPNIQKPIHHGAGCDGWKPIPGPSIGTQQAIAHSNVAAIQAVLPENTYLPPPSNSLHAAPEVNLQVQPLPTNLQLPAAGPLNFNHYDLEENIGSSHHDLGAHLGSSVSSGLGLTSINVVKSEGIELHSNSLDSYSAPPQESYAPDFHRRPPSGLTPPNSFPYNGPTFKQYPPRVNAPRHPVVFRPPVPQGLLESIGQSVQHQDTFGVKLQQQQSQVYLPPPTNEIPPPPQGLESLPLAPAAPFHQQHQQQQQYQQHQQQQQFIQKANLVDEFLYAPSQCSHGPNLAGAGGANAQYQSVPQFQSFAQLQSIPQFQSIPQLQTVYGVPPQPLDVSQSSSFEIAQSAGPNILDSYGPPASGAASNIDALINTHEEQSPSSSYGPPPSGNPADNFYRSDSLAHGSQKSFSSTQFDGLNNLNNNTSSNDTSDELPGLSSAGLDIISAQKSLSVPLEIPIQGQHGTYQLQFQAADPLASQNNDIESPDHQKLLSEGLLQSILSAIEQPKSSNDAPEVPLPKQSLDEHPEVNEFVNSAVGQETLSEVKAE